MPASNVSWPVPLQRLPPWYPGQFGVPGTDSDRGLRQDSNGKIIWVDPNHPDAHDGKDGTDPDSPMATVTGALTKCRAYSGDVIVVAFNGLWTYANPLSARVTPIIESAIVTVPGVRIVGLAPSSSLGVPWLPNADNAVCLTIDAMDVLVEGFCFWNAGAYAGTTAILTRWDAPTYYGENFTARNNYFYGLAYGVQADYSWNNHIEGNKFQGITTAAIHNPSVYGEPDYLTILGNVFDGNAADINLPDTDNCLIEANRFLDVTAAIVMLAGDQNTIHANTIQGDPAGANNMIDLTGGASNLVSQNVLSCTIAQYDVCNSDATSGSWVGNLCTNGTATAPPI
jgi:hypothetical protein